MEEDTAILAVTLNVPESFSVPAASSPLFSDPMDYLKALAVFSICLLRTPPCGGVSSVVGGGLNLQPSFSVSSEMFEAVT